MWRRRNAAEFQAFQRAASMILLAWGVLSMLCGAAAMAVRAAFARHVGLQALVWGAIDALIALVGLRNATQSHSGSVAAQARRLQAIVALNAGLDVLYVLGGRRLVQRAGGKPVRAGAGLGIIIQGLFLLLFDSALTLLLRRYTHR